MGYDVKFFDIENAVYEEISVTYNYNYGFYFRQVMTPEPSLDGYSLKFLNFRIAKGCVELLENAIFLIETDREVIEKNEVINVLRILLIWCLKYPNGVFRIF